MKDIKGHHRVNDILLGPLERPALRWLAAHMPPWVTPDILTLVGMLAALTILISYALSMVNRNFLWLASLGYVLNWFGDSLDGTLARYRHIERPRFGFFVDHTTDAFNEVMIFVGLGLTPYISFPAACLALIGYLLVSVLVYVRTCVVGEFQISYSKLGPTEIRVLAILLNIAMYFWGIQTMTLTLGIFGEISFSPYDLALVIVAVILLYFFMVTAIQETIRLAKVNE
jgi:phosphatidylglycerophosphate synthase